MAPLASTPARKAGTDGNYDVLLDVPNLSVDEIVLDVNGVTAHVALDARVAQLVQLTAGADVGIQRVYLGIRGVQAEAHLKVDLDNVTTIVDRVLTTIDRNPEIVSGLLETLNNTVNTVGSVANTALAPNGVVSQAVNTVGGIANTALQPGGVASQLVGTVGNTLNNLTGQGGLLSVSGVNALGNTLVRTVDASGNLVERTLDGTGKVVSQTGIGNVLNLPALSQTLNPVTGQLVRTVQDASGALIQVALDNTGKVLGTTVLNQTGGAGQLLNGVTGTVGAAAGDLANTASGVTSSVGGVAGAVANVLGGAQQLLLGAATDKSGQTVQRLVDAGGSLLERVVNPASGQVLSTRSLGSVLSLPLVSESLQPDGSRLRVVKDAAGDLLQLLLNSSGALQLVKPLASTALPH